MEKHLTRVDTISRRHPMESRKQEQRRKSFVLNAPPSDRQQRQNFPPLDMHKKTPQAQALEALSVGGALVENQPDRNIPR